jgi:pimeloyl-ACP methyl ester carboxylesterase
VYLEVLSEYPKAPPRPVPLLFVHGTCHAAWCWAEHFLPWFARKGYAAHALSLRGHGGSEGRDRLHRTSVDDYVEDVQRVAASLPCPPLVIGHSLGGLVVQRYLQRHDAPAAVLLAPSPVGGMLGPGLPLLLRHPLPMLRMLLRGDALALYGTPERARAFLFSPEAPETEVVRYAERMGPESHRALLAMVFQFSRLRRVRSPVLVAGGAADILVPPRYLERTARAFGGEAKVFPGLAHDVMLEPGWAAVAEHLLAWFASQGL